MASRYVNSLIFSNFSVITTINVAVNYKVSSVELSCLTASSSKAKIYKYMSYIRGTIRNLLIKENIFKLVSANIFIGLSPHLTSIPRKQNK
jgi:hypothetical protein